MRRRFVAFGVACPVALALIGCGPSGTGTAACSSGAGPGVAVLVSGSRSDVRPALTTRVLELLRVLVEGEDVTDGPGGRGVPSVVSSADGSIGPIVNLTPRRPNCQVEHGPRRGRSVEENLTALAAPVASVRAAEPGLDLVAALTDAVVGRDPACWSSCHTG